MRRGPAHSALLIATDINMFIWFNYLECIKFYMFMEYIFFRTRWLCRPLKKRRIKRVFLLLGAVNGPDSPCAADRIPLAVRNETR